MWVEVFSANQVQKDYIGVSSAARDGYCPIGLVQKMRLGGVSCTQPVDQPLSTLSIKSDYF